MTSFFSTANVPMRKEVRYEKLSFLRSLHVYISGMRRPNRKGFTLFVPTATPRLPNT